jgi:putative ubiquitin-RnfH superfamily antitoxin RatB of RatAB toxin-antitoxin module
MELNKLITIEIVYASVQKQKLLTMQVEEGTTIEVAIDRSGILELFPEIDLTKQKVGVFSQPRKLTDVVREGDRVEIYRPLVIDPKEARRRRVKKK